MFYKHTTVFPFAQLWNNLLHIQVNMLAIVQNNILSLKCISHTLNAALPWIMACASGLCSNSLLGCAFVIISWSSGGNGDNEGGGGAWNWVGTDTAKGTWPRRDEAWLCCCCCWLETSNLFNISCCCCWRCCCYINRKTEWITIWMLWYFIKMQQHSLHAHLPIQKIPK